MDEERNLRKEEREKAAADLKAALQRAHTEAQEEIKRQADAASKQQKEQQEIISKLQVWTYWLLAVWMALNDTI